MEEQNDQTPTQSPSDRLSVFIANNPEVQVEDVDGACVMNNPWGDESVTIRVSSEASELIDALNRVRLPPRFTAIRHLETKDVEFIYAPLREDHELRSRRFCFNFLGKEYTCEYRN